MTKSKEREIEKRKEISVQKPKGGEGSKSHKNKRDRKPNNQHETKTTHFKLPFKAKYDSSSSCCCSKLPHTSSRSCVKEGKIAQKFFFFLCFSSPMYEAQPNQRSVRYQRIINAVLTQYQRNTIHKHKQIHKTKQIYKT